MEFVIRNVRFEDLDLIAQVNFAAYGHPIDPIILRQYFELFSETYLVAVHEGEVVAFCIGGIKFGTDGGWILDLAVRPSCQNKGVGRRLTHKMFDLLREKGIRKLSLTVKPLNTVAIDLYTNIGFESGEIQSDYFGKGADRKVMWVYLQ
jgi:ribosomal-protein-alanine N-acetyltransferase